MPKKNILKSLILKVWESISEIGLKDEFSLEKKKTITITNQVSVTWALLAVPYLVVFFFTDAIGIYFISWLILTYLSSLLFNYLGYYYVARFSISIVPIGIINILSSIIVYEPNIPKPASFYMLNTAFLALPFLVFRLKEYKSIIVCISFSVFYFFSFEHVNAHLHMESASDFYRTEMFDVLTYLVTSCLVVFGFVYMKRTGDIYQKKVITLLNDTREKKEEIDANQEKMMGQMNTIIMQSEEITQSILYAQKIQMAVLPDKDEMCEMLDDYFVYFRPKDIVSGDFYWVQERNNIVSVAVCDCTGHGVPGGFLSMLCTAYLNEISNKHITDPAGILGGLRQMIIESLHQTGEVGKNHDGMDMAFCSIDKNKKQFSYAGANNPMIYIRDEELNILKPDKMPIGYYTSKQCEFTNHVFEYNDNDVFYLFTDGYADQFGGENRKKFRIDRFKKMLMDIYTKPFDVQKEVLVSTHIDWKQDSEQVDDILVLGFKV